MQQYSGVIAATWAFILWGILPVYWKALEAVPALEILCHRMVWSLIFTGVLILLLKRGRSLIKKLGNKSNFMLFSAAALLLSVNWLLYIWAVNSGYVIEASLGYYINPLISVVFGVILLKEKLRRGQYAALLLAFLGVAYLTFIYGQFPWIALSLACTFAVYGLLHKKTSLPALEGLCLETLVLFVPACLYLLYAGARNSSHFLAGGMDQTLLLMASGLITSLPLLLFGYAAQKIPLSMIGLLQYIAPSINLVLGIFLYNEPFPMQRMAGFVMIWAALLIYILEGVVLRIRQKRVLGVEGDVG